MRKMFSGFVGVLVGLTVLLVGPTSAHAVGPRHIYAGVSQSFTGTDNVKQLSADIYVAAPFIGPSTNFTLAEIALQDTATGDAVEVGWAVNPGTFGDSKPRLFSCRWNLGSIMVGCWNGAATGSGWFDNSSNSVNLGADLSTVAASCNGVNLNCVKNFQIKRVSGINACSFQANGWEIDYDGSKVGCWFGNTWSQNGGTDMTSANRAFAYAEIDYAGTGESTTDTGNGQYGDGATLSPTGPAYMASLTLGQKSPSTLTENFANNLSGTDTNAYRIQMYGANGFGYGGPGYKWNGSAWVTPGDIGS